jgi:aspartyl-tRNA(Asn)/glutamyl-tRNA(Gln) amidotransferase subunit A
LLGRTVEDVAILLNAVAGHDAADPASARRPASDYAAGLERGIQGMRLGVERDYFMRDIEPDARAAYEGALTLFKSLGAQLMEVNLEALESAPTAGLTILLAEAGALHQRRLRERGGDYDPATRKRLAFGALIPARDYVRAASARRQVAGLLRQTFEEYRLDALLTPTLLAGTLTMREYAAAQEGRAVPAALAGQFRNCVPFNLSGQPALTVPCGESERGLPLGMQIAGRPYQEERVLQIGRALEAAMPRRGPAMPVEAMQTATGAQGNPA